MISYTLNITSKLRITLSIVVLLIVLTKYYDSAWHDFGIYSDAGSNIWNKNNPYEDPLFRTGSIFALISFLIRKLLVDQPLIFLLLSIISIYIFIRKLNKKDMFSNQIAFVAVVILILPGRSFVSNLQITGFLIALITLLITNLRNPENTEEKFVLNAFLVALILDTRIHIGLLIILFLLRNKKNKVAFLSITLWLLILIFLSIYTQENLILNFINQLLHFSKESFTVGDSTAMWRFVNAFVNSANYVQYVSYALFVGSAVLILSRAKGIKSLLLLIAFPPLLLTYLHPYDLLMPIIILASNKYVNRMDTRKLSFIIGLSLVPDNNDSRLALIGFGLGLLTFVNYLMTDLPNKFGRQELKNAFRDVLIFCIGYFISYQTFSFSQGLIRVSAVIFMIVLVMSVNVFYDARNVEI